MLNYINVSRVSQVNKNNASIGSQRW